MLVLSRKKNESIMIGDEIEVEVISIEGDQVKIGIKAPKSIEVYRKEIFLAIQQENKEAMTANPNLLSQVQDLFNKNK